MSDVFSNEDLTAYLDGEATSELAARIATALKKDNALQGRLDRLEIDKQGLRTAFKHVSPQASDIHQLPPHITQNPSTSLSSWGKMAAGLVVGAFLGVAAMVGSNQASQQSWTMAVASYQALYTTDTLKFVDQSDGELASELARVSATLGKDINLTDLQSFEPLDYRRGQVLTFAGQPLIQLAFLTEEGKAVALCITKSTKREDSALNFSELHGLRAASWSKGDFEYIIIGGDDEALISDAAKQFQSRV